jgi:hypothetical protein
MVSVDEYESKVSDSNVVVGFYVRDRDAARDLNRFLQKSPSDIMDTEVSPAPDQRGYYIVFVELPYDARFGTSVNAILDEIAPLAEIDTWSMKVRHHRGLMDFTPVAIYKAVGKARGQLQEAAIAGFLGRSELPVARISSRTLTISGPVNFLVEGFWTKETVRRESNQAIDLSLTKVALTRRISEALGSEWSVDALVDGTWVLTRGDDSRVLLIRSVS